MSAIPATLDLSVLPAEARVPAVLASFDALSPDGVTEVHAPEAPVEILRALRRERPGTFEWSPLEEGPVRWRVRIDRRDATLGTLRLVATSLAWDHDRLEVIEEAAFRARERSEFGGAIATWADFSRGLQRHIRFEEELLFPLFEERSGLSPEAGPTAVMREEHAEIRQILARIGEEIASPGAEAETARRRLSYALAEHNVKEEEILYPAIDEFLSPEESDDLVWKIQSFR
jgi:uncharacterized protein (DUF2249 family)/hemerythrin superfamily protein